MESCKYNPYTLPTLDFVGGSTQDFLFHARFFANHHPFNLSACTASFDIINYVNREGTPLVSKEMQIVDGDEDEGGEVIPNVLSVTLTPADTVNLSGKYIYQITIKDVSGIVEIPNQGIIMITNNINKAFVV